MEHMNRKKTILRAAAITCFSVAAICFSVAAAIRLNASPLPGKAKGLGEWLFASHKITGSGHIETHNLGALQFNAVAASHAARVTVRDDGNDNVILRADDNILEYIDLKVHNGVLTVGMKESNIRNFSNITFEVSVPGTGAIRSLKANSAAHITVLPVLGGDKIELKASGASSITVSAEARECEAEASGASSITLTARCTDIGLEASGASKLTVDAQVASCSMDVSGASKGRLTGAVGSMELAAAGASKIDALACSSGNCTASASGASKVSVSCSGELCAVASGASKITYEGDCTLAKSEASGGSSIKRN